MGHYSQPPIQPPTEILDNGEMLACYKQLLAEFPDDADTHSMTAALP